MTRVGRNAVWVGTFLTMGLAYFVLAFGTFAMNGSASLPQNGYLMLRWPHIYPRNFYIAFDAPDIVSERFAQIPFIKRVAGRPGDEITVVGNTVCIVDVCRKLLPKLVDVGMKPLMAGVIPAGHLVVFGDTADSLDSRYNSIGLLPYEQVIAVGLPLPVPDWVEVRAWLDS